MSCPAFQPLPSRGRSRKPEFCQERVSQILPTFRSGTGNMEGVGLGKVQSLLHFLEVAGSQHQTILRGAFRRAASLLARSSPNFFTGKGRAVRFEFSWAAGIGRAQVEGRLTCARDPEIDHLLGPYVLRIKAAEQTTASIMASQAITLAPKHVL